MSGRTRNDLTLIGQIISDSMDRGFLGLAREMVRVFEVWAEAVGPYNAARTRPDSVKNGRLTVIVESPVWIDRLSYLKADFIQQINQALGTPMIRDLIFRVGRLSPQTTAPAAIKLQKNQNDVLKTPDQPAIQAAVSLIRDPELRSQLANFLARQRSPRPK